MSLERSPRSVAVVHDWLTGQRGGEHVLEAILELFPRATIFTLFHFPGSVSPAIERHAIRTSRLQRLSTRVSNYRYLLPLFPWAVSGWDLSSYDLVISSSHAAAKGVRTGRTPHICYCHTPMRYIWDRFDDYFPPHKPVRRLAAVTLAGPMREWDRRTADGVDAFVANSHFVASRIRHCYGQDAEVIHPFVDERFFELPIRGEREDFDLVVSALVPYKRIDLAIEAARRSGERLVIVGKGSEEEELKRLAAAAPVEFLGWVDATRVVELMASARTLLIPGVEDFGITPLEAMASGTPVVSIAEGGVKESVIDGVTGVLFHAPTVAALSEAISKACSIPWDRERIRNRARSFSRRRFQEEFRTLVEGVLASGVRPEATTGERLDG